MKKIKDLFLFSLLPSILVGAIFSAFYHFGILETIELKILDFRFRNFSKRLTPSKDIVIITIDQNSIDYLKYELGITWQWPRDIYANVIDYISACGGKGILLDFDFSDPDINRAEYEYGETDRALSSAIKRSGIVTNSAVFYKERINNFVKDDPNEIAGFAVNLEDSKLLSTEESGYVVKPVEPIMKYSRSIGAANIYPDRDGIIRKGRLFFNHKGKIYTSSSLSLILAAEATNKLVLSEDGILSFGRHTLKIEKDGDIYINWYGKGGPDSGTYRYFPIADVLLSSIQHKNGDKPKISADSFKDKIVLIGSNAPSLYDLKPTPFSNEKAYPAVEILATIINNILDHNQLIRYDGIIIVLFIFIVSVITSLIVSYIKSVLKNILFTAILLFTILSLGVYAFYQDIFLDIVPLSLSILFSFTVATVINYVLEGHEKRWIKKAFSYYMSPSVISEILHDPHKLKLGGEKRDITILFSDIRGFTSISEKIGPQDMVAILNEYFSPMTDAVFHYNGTLDKYIGDAIMAFFGAPVAHKDHPVFACDAALEMLSTLDRLKTLWKSAGMPENIQLMDIGIGINSGEASVGNIGGKSRFNYTVIGDEVNITSRLEAANKIYGTHIIVSENTYIRSKELFIYRELDYIRLRGKSRPVKIYELIKKRGENSEDSELMEYIRTFEQGLALYRGEKWLDAYDIFNAMDKKLKTDNTVKLFMERCNILRGAKLPEDWDGVFEIKDRRNV